LKALDTSVDLITTGDFMSRFCSTLGLPPTVQRAATTIARKAVELDIVPGRSPISVAAAAIYMTSQVFFHPDFTSSSNFSKTSHIKHLPLVSLSLLTQALSIMF